jgi:uncharacterized protein YecE (DUF72 family)
MEPVEGHIVRVGPAGWSYDDWEGIVYPPGMGKKVHPVEFLSQYFDTIEINSTFYRPPQARVSASWAKKASANERFKYTVKLWQRFTHEREEWPSEDEVTAFTSGIAPLAVEGKLGAVLVQFPWSFKREPESREWLARVIDAFSEYPLALEVRHASWDEHAVYEALAERGVAFCNIDQPLFGKSIKPTATVTSPVGYVRLHGRNAHDWFRAEAGRDERYNYLYSEEELKPWVEKIERITKTADETYVITNNHYRGQAVVNALEIQHKLGHPPVEVPASLLEHYPRLEAVQTADRAS